MVEAGLPGFRSTSWYALVGAARHTRARSSQQINSEVNAALKDDEVRSALDKLLLEPIPGSPDDAVTFIARETEQWTKVIKDAGIPVQ